MSNLSSIARRLLHFWIVWSALLLVHEAGHAFTAWRQGAYVRRITVGVGPALWHGQRGDTQMVLRLVPVAGITTVSVPQSAAHDTQDWSEWRRQSLTLAGGVLATLAFAGLIAGVVAASERSTRKRWVWGRLVIADAIVLTVFNFLPVPPLDGGRALLGAVAALRGAPLSADALFWVHVGGLALAVVPMTLWTRWTAWIDTAVMAWRPPPARS